MKAPRELPQLVSLKDVAAALDMDERTVRRLIGTQGRERLVAGKYKGRWKVLVSDLNDYIESHVRRAS